MSVLCSNVQDGVYMCHRVFLIIYMSGYFLYYLLTRQTMRQCHVCHGDTTNHLQTIGCIGLIYLTKTSPILQL